MKKLFIGFMICFIFLNCNKKKISQEKKVLYIISENNREIIRGKDTIPPPPTLHGWIYYGTNSFIIDTDSKVYYSQREEIGSACLSGASFSDTIPHFIDLHPKDLIEIPDSCIASFVKANYKKRFHNISFICSKSDTLKSESFFILKKALNSQKKYGDYYNIRRTSQEEDTVLEYKKTNKHYDPNSIKWDYTRIIFPCGKPNYKINKAFSTERY